MRRLLGRRGSVGRGGNAGGRRKFDASKLYALSGMSSSHLYDTAVGGGELGDLSGFGGAILLRTRAMVSAAQYLVRRNGASTGWQFAIVNTNDMAFYTWPYALASVKLAPVKIGRVMLLIFQQAPTAIRVIQDRLETTSTAAISGYTPEPGARERIGIGGDETNTFLNPEQFAHLRWRGTPTDAHLTALADVIRTLGDMPSKAAADAIFQAPVTDADVAALAPLHWYDAASVTPSGPNLLSMTNLGSAGGTITVGAGTVLLPTADAALDGKPSITLDGVNHYLTSSLPASAWRFLHDGTGAEVFCVFVPTGLPTNQVYWATGAAGNGVGAAHYSSNTLLSYLVQNGTGTTAQLVNLGALVVGTPVYTDSTFGLSETPDMVNRLKSVPVSTGADITLTPAAGDALSTLRIGANYAGGQRCSMRLAAWIGFNRVLTPAQRITMQQYMTTRWGLDRATTTHRWSLRTELAKGFSVSHGQVAPLSLPDTVTGAAVDAMARTGSPTVAVIDPAIDGRKSYGALGFSVANHLKSANGLGIRATATAFSVRLVVIFRSIAAGVEYFASAANASATTGWAFYRSGAAIYACAGNGTSRESTRTLVATDLHIPHTVDLLYDGTAVTLVFDGIAATPVVGAVTDSAAAPMVIGGLGAAISYPAVNEEVYVIAGDIGLTLTQVQDAANAYRRTAVFQSFGAATLHLYDLTQDVTANGGPQNGISATVQDRVGSDHLTRVGGLGVISNGAATGLRNFVAASNILSTPTGFAGAASFWASALIAPQTLSGVRLVFGKSNHSTSGWSFGINGAYIVTYVADGGVNTAGPQLNMGAGAGYLNVLVHIAMVLSAGTLTLYVNGVSAGTPLAVTTFTPGTTAMVIGATNGGALYAATGVDVFGAAGGHFAPTAGEIATASASSLSTGVIAAVPAKTSHRYDLKADITEAGGVAPTRSVERTSGVDSMVVINAKLEVAQRVERLWSYESTPIMYGARNWSINNLLSTAGGVAATAVNSYWFAIALVVNAKAGTAFQVIGCKANAAGSQGYNVYTSGTNGSLVFSHGNGTAPVTGGTYSIATAAVGKVIFAFGQWTGTVTQFFADRVKQGSDTATAAYTPYAGAFNVGRHPDSTSNPCTDHVTVLGFMGGNNTYLSLAEVQAATDAFVASEDLVAVPGKTDRLWSIKRAQNGTLQPILDAQGSGETLAITGGPTLASLQSRAFNW